MLSGSPRKMAGRNTVLCSPFTHRSRRVPASLNEVYMHPLMKIWNECCEKYHAPFPRIRAVVGLRKKMADSRWKEISDDVYWENVFKEMLNSEFLTGKTGWVANFDFFIRQNSHLKVLEGNYNSVKMRARVLESDLE